MRWFAWFVCFIAWAVPLYAQKDSLPMYYTFPNLKQESPAWATPQQREALQTLAQMKQKLAYLEARNDQKEMAMLAHRIGVECDKQADYPSALQFFLKSLKIRQLLQDQKGIASSLNSIGIVYQNQDDYHKALAYFQQSLDIKQKIGDKIGMSTTLNNIGIAYRKLKNYDKALASYQQSLQIREFAQDKRLIAMSLSNIATVYEHQQKYALALEYYQKSIQIKEELQDKLGLIFSLQGLANIYREQQQYAPSIVCAEKALLLAIAEKSYREVSISAEQLYKAYKLNAEYDKALRYHELYKKTQDSIFSIDKTRLIAKLETDMAMEKQQQIIEKHAKDLEIAQKQADADRMKNLAQEEMHKHRTDVLQGIAQKTRLETERLKAEKKASTLEMQKHKEEKEFQRVILYLILLGLMGAVSAVWVIFRSNS
jgi:tetratricopeptide (TPR) repeat protein